MVMEKSQDNKYIKAKVDDKGNIILTDNNKKKHVIPHPDNFIPIPKTSFEPVFIFDDKKYRGATNPDLDGYSVLVFAIRNPNFPQKGQRKFHYSFMKLSEFKQCSEEELRRMKMSKRERKKLEKLERKHEIELNLKRQFAKYGW